MKKTKMIIVVDTKSCIKGLFPLLQMRGFSSIVEAKDGDGREVQFIYGRTKIYGNSFVRKLFVFKIWT